MHMTSVSLFLAALAGSPATSAPPPMAVRAEARATVRILRGARIHWDMRERPEGARLTRASFREQEGTALRAHFLEFE